MIPGNSRRAPVPVLLSCAMLLLSIPLAGSLAAQESSPEETEEIPVESTIGATPEQQDQAAALAKTVQNPIAALVSLPFQYNVNTNFGEFERVASTMNVQPVVPFKLGKGAHLVTRTILPITSVPTGETESEFGFGDIQWSGFYSPKAKGGLSFGIGAQTTLPTASNEKVLGAGKWSLGPSAVLFYGVGKWTMGFVASNIWSVANAGGEERRDVNFFFAQWFLNYNLGNGLAGRGRVDEAIASYRMAVEIKPNFAEAHNNLGAALVRQRRFDEAIGHFQKTLAIIPDYAGAHGNLALALAGQGRLDRAIL